MSFALTHGEVRLRLVRMKDVKALEACLFENRDWLRPWEATSPNAPQNFDVRRMVRGLLRGLDEQTGMPFVIEYRGQVVGQLNVANMLYGSVSSAMVGYWVVPSVAGKGITPVAVALVTDYLMTSVGLHRVEIDIRPENSASLRVVEKLGFRYEGKKERYIHINGAWRDHYCFAVTHEEIPKGMLNRFLRNEVPVLEYPFPRKPRQQN